MKRLHLEIPLEDEGTASSKHSMTGEVSTSSKATIGVKMEPIDLVEDGPLDRFTNEDPTTKVGARKAVQRAIYECINDLGSTPNSNNDLNFVMNTLPIFSHFLLSYFTVSCYRFINIFPTLIGKEEQSYLY